MDNSINATTRRFSDFLFCKTENPYSVLLQKYVFAFIPHFIPMPIFPIAFNSNSGGWDENINRPSFYFVFWNKVNISLCQFIAYCALNTSWAMKSITTHPAKNSPASKFRISEHSNSPTSGTGHSGSLYSGSISTFVGTIFGTRKKSAFSKKGLFTLKAFLLNASSFPVRGINTCFRGCITRLRTKFCTLFSILLHCEYFSTIKTHLLNFSALPIRGRFSQKTSAFTTTEFLMSPKRRFKVLTTGGTRFNHLDTLKGASRSAVGIVVQAIQAKRDAYKTNFPTNCNCLNNLSIP